MVAPEMFAAHAGGKIIFRLHFFSADLADGLLILFSFAAARGPRADDADIIAAFGVDDNQISLM